MVIGVECRVGGDRCGVLGVCCVVICVEHRVDGDRCGVSGGW